MVTPSVIRPSIPPKLSTANRQGWRQWLIHNSIYPRVALALCTAALLCAPARASEPLPNAPTVIDYSLAATIVSERALDFTSTEQCLRRPYAQCHEIELPNTLVRSKASFVSFEVGMAGISIFEQYELTKHGHRKLARCVQFTQIGVLAFTGQHNYRLAGGR
jgi:hypothetical protein